MSIRRAWTAVILLYFLSPIARGSWTPEESAQVDFIQLSTPANTIHWNFTANERRGSFLVNGETFDWGESQIPTYAVDLPQDRLFVLSRRILSNNNLAQVLSISQKTAAWITLPEDLLQGQIWAANSYGSNVYLVYYKPRARSTYLVKCEIGGSGGGVFSDRILVDNGSLNPAISVTPKILFLANEVYVVGGPKISIIPRDLASAGRSFLLPTNNFLCDSVISSNRIIGLALGGMGFADKGGCTNGCVPNYSLWDVTANTQYVSKALLDTPVRLRTESGQPFLQFARATAQSVSEWVETEVFNGVGGGGRYLGIGNSETHLGWAGAEMILNWIDLVTVFQESPSASFWKPLLQQARRRLDLEIYLLDQMLDDPKAALESTRQSFSGGDPIIMAVMSARLLRVLQRYQEEVHEPQPIRNFAKLEKMVEDLEGHLEELVPARAGLLPSSPYLRWKYGSPVDYDGVNLPFNMQNTWADAMLSSPREERRQAAEQMMLYFLDREEMLQRDVTSHPHWRYWWGDAYNGWSAAQNISSNRPSFTGYKNAGSVGYRSIDAAAVLRLDRLRNQTILTEGLVRFLTKQVETGTLFPPVGGELPSLPSVPRRLLNAYSRGGGSEDFRHMIWAFALTLNKEGAPEWPGDTDGDGALDIEETILGTDPRVAEVPVQFDGIQKTDQTLTLSWRGIKNAVFELQSANTSDASLNWKPVDVRTATDGSETNVIPLAGHEGQLFRIIMLGVAIQ